MLVKDIIFSNELQDSLSMAAQAKRIGESKVIAARAEVESAKLMRQAADILSSAPAMQIRYLEAMQAMAKSANSKVIFLPGIGGGGDMAGALEKSLVHTEAGGAGPSGSKRYEKERDIDFGDSDNKGFNSAIKADIIEHM